MRRLPFVGLLLLTLTGCTPKVQVVTLRGSNVRPAPEGLIFDNDTLTLRYDFASERGQMRITLINKLNQPLYVDWKRSSFIVGQRTFPYWYDVANINLTGQTFTSVYGGRYGRYAVSSMSFSGTAAKEESVAFIPPQTQLNRRQFVVFPDGPLPTPGTPAVVPEQPTYGPRKKMIPVSVYTYRADGSPLRFRNYLTLSTDKDFKNEFRLDTHFWASDVRVEPKPQVVGVAFTQPDGTYRNLRPFAQRDAFYVPLSAR